MLDFPSHSERDLVFVIGKEYVGAKAVPPVGAPFSPVLILSRVHIHSSLRTLAVVHTDRSTSTRPSWAQPSRSTSRAV